MNQRLQRSLSFLILGGLLVLAACSGASSTPTPPAVAATASASASASESPSETASEATSPSESPIGSLASPGFSLPSGAKDLEAMLPDTIGGTALRKASFAGADFLQGAGANGKQFTDFLSMLGKSPSDVSFAIAFDPTGKLQANIGALRIAGADQAQLLATFISAGKQSSPNAQVTQTNLGGKAVTKIVDPTDTAGNQFVYAKGDVLFFVQTKDDATAGTALSALP